MRLFEKSLLFFPESVFSSNSFSAGPQQYHEAMAEFRNNQMLLQKQVFTFCLYFTCVEKLVSLPFLLKPLSCFGSPPLLSSLSPLPPPFPRLSFLFLLVLFFTNTTIITNTNISSARHRVWWCLCLQFFKVLPLITLPTLASLPWMCSCIFANYSVSMKANNAVSYHRLCVLMIYVCTKLHVHVNLVY